MFVDVVLKIKKRYKIFKTFKNAFCFFIFKFKKTVKTFLHFMNTTVYTVLRCEVFNTDTIRYEVECGAIRAMDHRFAKRYLGGPLCTEATLR